MAGISAYAFIDSGHVRSGLTRIGASWQELNLGLLGQVLPRWIGANWQGEEIRVNRVFVYDAVPDDSSEEPQVAEWLERNRHEIDVDVRYGRLAGEPPGGRRQKGVDVQLTVDALSFAVNHIYDIAILVAGDGDFVPLVEAIRERGPLVCVCGFKSKLSDELARRADRVGYLLEDPKAYSAWRLPDVKPGGDS